jgi:hypothetical protein
MTDDDILMLAYCHTTLDEWGYELVFERTESRFHGWHWRTLKLITVDFDFSMNLISHEMGHAKATLEGDPAHTARNDAEAMKLLPGTSREEIFNQREVTANQEAANIVGVGTILCSDLCASIGLKAELDPYHYRRTNALIDRRIKELGWEDYHL